MKKGIGFVVVVSVMALSILACQVGGLTGVRGSGNVVEEDRAVSGFTGVALAVIAFASGYWFNLNFPLLFTVLGAVILFCGIVVLVQFMRKYPIPKDKQTG